MPCRVGHKGVYARLRGLCGAPAQTRATTSVDCARAVPTRWGRVHALSTDAWARRHARAFVPSSIAGGAFAHPTHMNFKCTALESDCAKVCAIAIFSFSFLFLGAPKG